MGDKVPISLSGTAGICNVTGTWYARIIGIDHNSSTEGTNTLHFQFPFDSSGKGLVFVDSDYDKRVDTANKFCMNSSAGSGVGVLAGSNIGGYHGSTMCQTIMPSMLNTFTNAWRIAIKAIPKYRDNWGGGIHIDKNGYIDERGRVSSNLYSVWLLSEYEIYGHGNNSYSAEIVWQEQYEFYKNGNSRIKYKHNSQSEAAEYWLSSTYYKYISSDPDLTNSYSNHGFVMCYTDGYADDCSSNKSLGIAPCFVVG